MILLPLDLGLCNAAGGAMTKIKRVQKKLGSRIRRLRQKRGLTSEQLGKDCGITALKISRIENGEVNVGLSTMVHVSERLGIKVDRLVHGIR